VRGRREAAWLLEPSSRPTLLGASQALRHHISDGLLVAILGSMSPIRVSYADLEARMPPSLKTSRGVSTQ